MAVQQSYVQHARYHLLVLVAPWDMVQRPGLFQLLRLLLCGCHYVVKVEIR